MHALKPVARTAQTSKPCHAVPHFVTSRHSPFLASIIRLASPCLALPRVTRRAVAEMQQLRASISLPTLNGRADGAPKQCLKAQHRWQSAVTQVNTLNTLSPVSKKRVRKKPQEERGMPRTVSLPSLGEKNPVKSSGLIHTVRA